MHIRAVIAHVSTGGVRAITCRTDGEPEKLGRVLREHYATGPAAFQLVSLGDCTRVAGPIEEHVSAAHPDIMRGHAYAMRSLSRFEVLMADIDAFKDYLYVYRDGKWEAYRTRFYQYDAQVVPVDLDAVLG